MIQIETEVNMELLAVTVKQLLLILVGMFCHMGFISVFCIVLLIFLSGLDILLLKLGWNWL